jgi:hypothetical protein
MDKEYAMINRYLHENGIDADPNKHFESILEARDKIFYPSGSHLSPEKGGKFHTNKLYDDISGSKQKGSDRLNSKSKRESLDRLERMSNRLGSGNRSQRSTMFGDRRSQYGSSPDKGNNGFYDKIRNGNYNYQQTQ